MTIVHRTRADLATRPIAVAITTRGKELSIDDTVADARRLLAARAIRVVPVLDGAAYVGAVDRDAIGADAPPSAAIGPLASPLLPTTTASTPAAEALAALDRDGGKRLVVLADDDATYVGLVCLRGDRDRLCVDAELTDDPITLSSERTTL